VLGDLVTLTTKHLKRSLTHRKKRQSVGVFANPSVSLYETNTRRSRIRCQTGCRGVWAITDRRFRNEWSSGVSSFRW
jgi:hypothetical protein